MTAAVGHGPAEPSEEEVERLAEIVAAIEYPPTSGSKDGTYWSEGRFCSSGRAPLARLFAEAILAAGYVSPDRLAERDEAVRAGVLAGLEERWSAELIYDGPRFAGREIALGYTRLENDDDPNACTEDAARRAATLVRLGARPTGRVFRRRVTPWQPADEVTP